MRKGHQYAIFEHTLKKVHMKNSLHISTMLILLGIISMCIFSCNTTKNKSAEAHIFIITLDDTLNGDYIKDTYKDYNPNEVAKSNRTLNQYQAKFVCNESELSSLKSKLSNDERIVSFNNSNKSSIKNTQGKNVNHAKTKSIRDKN